MAKSNDDTAADKKELQDKAELRVNSPNMRPQGLPILAMIMAALALASSLYAIYASQHLGQTTGKLTTTINGLKEQQTNAQTGLKATTETVNQAQQEIQERLQELDKNLQMALQQHLYQKQDWLLLKARYYLELAQINAYWSHNQLATIALLKQADDLLATISDQQLFPVRQAIAKEIAQLQALPKVDIAGLLSQLDAAQGLVAELPIKQAFNRAQNNDMTKPDNQETSAWRDKLRASMNSLEKLVIIRHNDEDTKPLLSPLHEAVLRESIHMNLQEAQWAILQNNAAVYQLALTQALNNVKRTFDDTAKNTQALVQQLEALQQEKLFAQKPPIEESLPLLNQLIESKNSQGLDVPPSTEGEKSP